MSERPERRPRVKDHDRQSAETRPRAGDASGTGTGASVGAEPPPEIKGDPVDEASWASFPASDAPAWTRGPRAA